MRILRDPFVQFLALGALIFIAYTFSQSAQRDSAEKRIAIDAPTQNWIYSNFTKEFRRPPTRLEMGVLIRAHIEHEVKYREALAMGLDERDSIVRRRMMQKFDFLFGNGAADLTPEDDVLQNWYNPNAPEFSLSPTISFTHLWFSPDTRGANAKSDAAAALILLQSGDRATGDPFPFDVSFTNATPIEVRNVLGPEFTAAVFDAPTNEWTGPIQSGLGIHLIHVTQKTEGSAIPFQEIRDLILQQWRETESDRILQEMIANLKAQYEIKIDEDALIQFDYTPEDTGPAQ